MRLMNRHVQSSVHSSLLSAALVLGLCAASPMQGQQVSCPNACSAEPAAGPPPAGWTLTFKNTANGKGDEDCGTCRSCNSELTYVYSGAGGAEMEIWVWDAELGEYVKYSEQDLTGHESGTLSLTTDCDADPNLVQFTSPEGNVSATLHCPCNHVVGS